MHTGPITSIVITPDGRWAFTGGYDKNIFVWDRQTGASELVDKHEHLVNFLSLANDGTILASSSSDYSIRLYDVKTRSRITILHGHSDDVEGIGFSPDDRYLISSARDRRCLVWDVENGRIVSEFKGHKRDINSIWVYEDRVFSADDNGRCLVWNYKTCELISEIGPFDCDMDAVGGSTRTGKFAIGGDDGRLMLLDAKTLELELSIQAHDRGVKRVGFSSSGRYLLSAGYDHLIKVWEAETLELVQELQPSVFQWERAIAWAPDETSILSGSFGNVYCEWRLEDAQLLTTLECATPSINDLAVASSALVVTASDDGKFRINGLPVLDQAGVLTNGVGISADGKLALWGDHAGNVHLVDLTEKNLLHSLQTGTGPINSIKYSTADDLFYVVTYGGFVHLYDPVQMRWVKEWQAHPGAVKAVEVNEQYVVTGTVDGSAKVFAREDISKVRPLVASVNIVNDLCLHPSGTKVVTVGRDKVVRLLDLETCAILAQHTSHDYSIKSVAVNESGIVFAGDYWGYLTIWNPAKTDGVFHLRVAENGISAIRALGDTVYAASYDGSVYRIDSEGKSERVLQLFEQNNTREAIPQ